YCSFFSCCCDYPDLHSFPTRRSSDLTRNCKARRSSAMTSGDFGRCYGWRSKRCTLVRSTDHGRAERHQPCRVGRSSALRSSVPRSEEHTSELQSRGYLVCRLLLEKKK